MATQEQPTTTVETSIFPEIKILSPMAVVSSLGAWAKRIYDLGSTTELMTSNHIRR